jgi:glycosyltransferase involved in cell wall biosynthesis
VLVSAAVVTRESEEGRPRVSVIVRSYNRLGAFAELLQALLAQDHDSFEIVVVEQSTHRPTAHVARITELAVDPRVRLLETPPLGGTGARNHGARASRGDILAFIDDDDLPGDRQWLRNLEANFIDDRCLAVTGRQIVQGGKQPPYRNMIAARRKVMSYSWLMWQRCYTQVDQRCERVEGIHGTNAAIRRSTLERFGLWDTCCEIEDESSLCFRILRGKGVDEYLMFDPTAVIVRRTDIPGGLDKRGTTTVRFGQRMFTYLHNIVGHYHRGRFVLLYPAYMLLLWYLVCERIYDGEAWKYAGRPVRKAASLVVVTLAFPALWLFWMSTWARKRLASPVPSRAPALAALEDGATDPIHELRAVA